MKNTFLAIAFMATVNLFSQNYDLNNYKYRFQKWRLSGINFLMSGNHNQFLTQSSTKYNDTSGILTDVQDESSYNNHSFALQMPLFFELNINTERLQQTQRFQYSLDLKRDKNIDNKIWDFDQNLSYNNTSRLYKGNKFTQITFNTQNSFSTESNRSTFNSSEYRFSRNYYLNYSASIGIGKGRLEYVSDAVAAIFLLNDLKSKTAAGTFSNEQIDELAKGITDIRNRRYMDFRFRLIDQLSMLDSVVSTIGIKSEKNIRYFTTLSDNWLYAARFARFSGKLWAVSVVNEGINKNSYYRYESGDTLLQPNWIYNNRYSFNGINLEYRHSKQHGLKIQHSYGFSLKSGINFNTNQQRSDIYNWKNKSDDLQNIFNPYYSFLFQPDSRTFIDFGINVFATYEWDLIGLRISNPQNLKRNTINLGISPGLKLFRFVSPRLYFNADISTFYGQYTNHIKNDFIKSNKYSYTQFPFRFNTGLTYLFF